MSVKSTKQSTKKPKSSAPKASKSAPKAAPKTAAQPASAQKMDDAVQNVLDSALQAAPAPAAVSAPAPAAVSAPEAAPIPTDHALTPRPSDAVAKKESGTVAKKEAGTVAVKQSAPPAVKNSGTVATVGETPPPKATVRTKSREIQPMDNPYLPEVATVAEVINETSNIKTLRVVMDNPEKMAAFTYQPGQVGQLSLFGVGEATFVINSPPSQKDYLQFSIMRAGEVTAALHSLSPGDKVGVRAPLGNSFPYQDWKGKNIVFVGGGIGMAPIRTIMLHVLENSKDYGKISLLYGARTPRDMAFSYEAEEWLRRPDLDCTLTIDAPFEGWPHKVGLIPHVLLDMGVKPENTIAVLCGPPVMIKFTVEALKKLDFPDSSIVTTLERRMKCGVGLCGRCNLGGKYICVDGPVFTWEELKKLPAEL